MNKVILTTALILSVAAPAFAGPTAAEIHTRIAAEDETRNKSDRYLGGVGTSGRLSTKGQSVADGIFARLFEEDDSNNNSLNFSASSKGRSDRASAIFQQLFNEDEDNNNSLKN